MARGAGEILRERFVRWAASDPGIGDVRGLGAMMAAGCLIENEIRGAIRAGGDRVAGAVGGVMFALAVAMAVVGVRAARSAGDA